jgi:glycosyltransferase involved in cell wall biosynthesis
MESILKNLGTRLYKIRGFEKLREDIREEMDLIRSRLDIPDALFEEFQDARSSAAYRSVFELQSPLVSVCVATYNRANLLLERCVRSILAQDYANLELIVIGDCCTDETAEMISQVRDERLKFVNLPQRGIYPEDKNLRWMVAGTTPGNYGLKLARGDFITHLDDDDEYRQDRLSKLLKLIQETQADVVWHPFNYETPEGKWKTNPAEKFRFTQVTTSSVLYHNWFKRIPVDLGAYRYREPADWNRYRKFRYLGAKMIRHPEPLMMHYKERNQKK